MKVSIDKKNPVIPEEEHINWTSQEGSDLDEYTNLARALKPVHQKEEIEPTQVKISVIDENPRKNERFTNKGKRHSTSSHSSSRSLRSSPARTPRTSSVNDVSRDNTNPYTPYVGKPKLF